MAIAVRIARTSTGKDKIAFCGYHGWHDWYLSANLGTENALGEHLLPGLSPRGVPRGLTGTAFPFRYNHLDELEAIISKHRKELAAVIMEPIRSDNPEPGFLEGVRALADETGAVLIIDEISAGFRMNSGGAHMLFSVIPDMAVYSKAMGNGFPIAAVIGKDRVMTAAQDTFISSTMWTERVGPAAALATIKKHRDCRVGHHLVEMGGNVQEGWKKSAEKSGLDIKVGGIPPTGHFTFSHEQALSLKSMFVQLMLERGFLASNLFYAMFSHKAEHIKAYLQAVDDVFLHLAFLLQKGTLKHEMKGKPATEGFRRLA
jgi:glutamate-1-semialdehyde 2,1-aminomutase